MRRTEALSSVKFYQILSIFIFFNRLIILEDFIRLISYNGPCVRLGCSFFLATALKIRMQMWLIYLLCPRFIPYAVFTFLRHICHEQIGANPFFTSSDYISVELVKGSRSGRKPINACKSCVIRH